MWWLGAHGGAGESTLEELFSGSRAADHSWPLTAANQAPARVVLTARTHARGLSAAQSAIREWAGADVQVLLLGLVLIADAPGRLPRGLRQLADLIAGGVPAVWWLPWIEAWRVGEPPAPHNAPKVVRQLLEDLQAMTEAEPRENGRALMSHTPPTAVTKTSTERTRDVAPADPRCHQPGAGEGAPGAGKLTTILQWTAWGVFALCVGGVLISAAKLAHSHQQGYGGASQHTTSLVWTLVACVIAGSSAAIVGALS